MLHVWMNSDRIDSARALALTVLACSSLLGSVSLAGCSSESKGQDQLGSGELERLRALSPLPDVPADTTNAVADDPAARALGQRFFFDPRFSGALRVASDLGAVGEVGKVSCASCHSGPGLDDRRSMPRTVSLGTDFHPRNSPPLVNSSYYRWTNWGGRFSAQWELPLPVSENPVTMNGNRLAIVHRIAQAYADDYAAVFGVIDPAIEADAGRFPALGKPKPAPTDANPNPADGAWEAMAAADRTLVNQVFANFGKALAAYVRGLVSRVTPFDRFVRGEGGMSESAIRGAGLFVGKARCNECHSSPHFSDDDFHNLGVAQTGERVPAMDGGRFADIPPLLASPFNSSGAFSDNAGAGRLNGLVNPAPEATRGAFRTANLRGVAQTGPYMHSGQIATLADVVDFYDRGGGEPAVGTRDTRLRPLGLSDIEKADVVAFLESLSGEPVAAELLEDTSARE